MKKNNIPAKAILLSAFSCLLLAAQAQLYVQNGATLSTIGNAVITLQDIDLQNNGTISQASTGKFVFSGSGNNSIGGSGGLSFDILEIAKTSGSILSLSQNMSIGYSINFTSGLIELNGRNITLMPNAILNNENEASRIIGSGGGNVQTSFVPLVNPWGSNLGNLGAVIYASSYYFGSTQISRRHAPATKPAGQSGPPKAGIQRTYFINPQNDAPGNAKLRFYYLDAELNGNDFNTLVLWKSDDGINWALAGADTRVHDATGNYVEKSGIASFSTWTLTDANNALPIKLLSFSAVCENNGTLIKWATASEVNAANFILEKSADGVAWSTISSITASNTTTGSAYQYTDDHPADKAFYRLKMNDKDGHFDYSPIFSGGCSDVPMPFSIYPNPAYSSTVAHISVRQATAATVKIFNAAGQLLQSIPLSLSLGNNPTVLQTGMLPTGSYFVQVLLANGDVLKGKFLKQ